MKYMFSANLQGLKELNATESVTSGGVVVEGAKMDKLTFTNKGVTFLYFYFITKCHTNVFSLH